MAGIAREYMRVQQLTENAKTLPYRPFPIRATQRRMKIAVIGGGAAGLMAAATLLESAPDADVVLIEKNNF